MCSALLIAHHKCRSRFMSFGRKVTKLHNNDVILHMANTGTKRARGIHYFAFNIQQNAKQKTCQITVHPQLNLLSNAQNRKCWRLG